MNQFEWICPFCQHAAMVTDANYCCHTVEIELTEAKRNGTHKVNIEVIHCPNPSCRMSTLTTCINTTANARPSFGTPKSASALSVPPYDKELVKKWNLIPSSKAKVFPSYVPEAIRNDYAEAFLISEHSPKAAATLARRCLQGMIRDFHKVTKSRLVDEINAIKDKVHPLTWQAIEAVRHVGNIGAHMEKDVNIIVDVEEGEASQLLGLVEMLVDDWYVVSHEREKQLQALIEMAEKKKAQLKGADPSN